MGCLLWFEIMWFEIMWFEIMWFEIKRIDALLLYLSHTRRLCELFYGDDTGNAGSSPSKGGCPRGRGNPRSKSYATVTSGAQTSRKI